MNDSRRSFLAISAGAVAACAGLAVTALPAIASADPIFAAIDAHRAAVANFNEEHAKTIGLRTNEVDWQPYLDAFKAWSRADCTLVDTVPTTPAGLTAFEAYLRNECAGRIGYSIWRPHMIDGVRYPGSFSGIDGGGIDYLIALRARGDRSRVSAPLVA